MGASLGGLVAVEAILAGLPASFPVPIAIVLHRSARSGGPLRTALQRHSKLKVVEPLDKEPIVPGIVYLAPADYHLLVDTDSFALSTEAAVRHSRPSIDVLFETAADTFGASLIAVILTGASDDGARGCLKVKQRGGTVIVQDPLTAECPLMPQSALRSTQVDRVLAIGHVARQLISLCDGSEEA